MNNRPVTQRTIDLGYEQLFVFEGGPDTRVRVLFGGTWLTEEGAAGDAFVPAGSEVLLHSHGNALIEGLGPTRVQIIDTPGQSLGHLAAHRLGRLVRSLRRLVERLHLGARPAVEPRA